MPYSESLESCSWLYLQYCPNDKSRDDHVKITDVLVIDMALLSLLQAHASADRGYRIDRQYAKRDNPRYGTGLVEPGIMGPPADRMRLATYEQVIE